MYQPEILLIEDDSLCLELALRALKRAGYGRVAVARDGVEAVEMLLGEGEVPAIVLLDLKLPRLDGVHVLQRIRREERTRNLKVIALSASEDPEELEQCLSLGVVAVVPKPLDPEVLKQWL